VVGENFSTCIQGCEQPVGALTGYKAWVGWGLQVVSCLQREAISEKSHGSPERGSPGRESEEERLGCEEVIKVKSCFLRLES
jgi:hypothetical protein